MTLLELSFARHEPERLCHKHTAQTRASTAVSTRQLWHSQIKRQKPSALLLRLLHGCALGPCRLRISASIPSDLPQLLRGDSPLLDQQFRHEPDGRARRVRLRREAHGALLDMHVPGRARPEAERDTTESEDVSVEGRKNPEGDEDKEEAGEGRVHADNQAAE